MHMPAFRRQWTVDDLQDLPDDGQRYEVIDGELFVTPAPTVTHETILARLARILDPYVAANGLGYVYRPRAAIRYGNAIEVEPDLMVRQPPENPSAGWASPPMPILVAEGVSDTTRRRDHVHKRELYINTLGIPEYWILDGEERTVRIIRPGVADVAATESMIWRPSGVSEPLVFALTEVFWPPTKGATGGDAEL